MILSNEPGYYKPGAYGIRIENLVVVERQVEGAERPMLGLETLTMAPIDRTLIEPGLLTAAETLSWLEQETTALTSAMQAAKVTPSTSVSSAPASRLSRRA
jgi:Xaa-Pro aminopeptidase